MLYFATMGRKSLDKQRIANDAKTDLWLENLLPLLQDRNLAKLNMDQIAKLIGKSKSTIYQYFKTKDEIFARLVDIKLDQVQDSISGNHEDKSTLELYEHFVIRICKGLDGITIHFIDQMKTVFPAVWVKIERFMNQVLAFLKTLYLKGMNEGIFKNYPLSLLLGMDEFFMYQYITRPDRPISDVDELVRHYMALRLEGLKAV